MTALDAIVPLLHELADASEPAIMPFFRSHMRIDSKNDQHFDPVTEADRAAERTIRDAIRERFPEHGIVGEEFSDEQPGADVRWVIDPIDGTRSFIQGMPTWGTLIGVVANEKPVAGLMNQPFTGERVWSDGTSSYCRVRNGADQRIRCRPAQRGSVQMSTTDPGLFAAGFEMTGFEAVRARAQSCRYGADCYAYCLLAAGHIDVVMEAGLKPYDIMALIPIIENAGGVVSTWDGGPATQGGRILACGDKGLHGELLRLLSELKG